MKQPYTSVLSEKLTRREFLIYVGLLLISLSGMSKLTDFHSSHSTSKNAHSTRHFGSGAYGA